MRPIAAKAALTVGALGALTTMVMAIAAADQRSSVSRAQLPATIGSPLSGSRVQAQWSAEPPQLTPEQRALVEGQLSRTHLPGPAGPAAVVPRLAVAPDLPGIGSVSIAGPSNVGIAAAVDFTVFRDSIVPQVPLPGALGPVQEPSTDAGGKNIFQTGNWYTARSLDNGATWAFLDPFSIFGTGFCCDQVTIYEPGRDVQFWLLQYSDHLVIAIGRAPFTAFCAYGIGASTFGQPAGTVVDYNDLAAGTNFLYVVSNLFPPAGGMGSGILRLPIDTLADPTCPMVTVASFADFGFFTIKPVQGAADTMFFGSNWPTTGTLGSSFRVYAWPENSLMVTTSDAVIDAFAFELRNSGQNCASADAAVTNWCEFSDSRVLGGTRANGILTFSFNASQDVNFPFPYSRRVRFRESDLAHLGFTTLALADAAVQFEQMNPNVRGHSASVFALGGGVGTTHVFPSAGLLIEDDIAKTSVVALSGQGNACVDTASGLNRWGDYLTVRAFHPAADAWIATAYAILGADCGALGSRAEAHNWVFGRGRDAGSVMRWWTN